MKEKTESFFQFETLKDTFLKYMLAHLPLKVVNNNAK